jgi:hypothetical protein
MYLKRAICKDLVAWKNSNSGNALLLEGARQVGKTYILNKFANENYKNVIYVNMFQLSGINYLKCLHKASDWQPGDNQIKDPLHLSLTLFYTDFVDDESTAVIIDEIQESSEVAHA